MHVLVQYRQRSKCTQTQAVVHPQRFLCIEHASMFGTAPAMSGR